MKGMSMEKLLEAVKILAEDLNNEAVAAMKVAKDDNQLRKAQDLFFGIGQIKEAVYDCTLKLADFRKTQKQ
jgi:hypothetical protein